MARTNVIAVALAVASSLAPAAALAQRVGFERTFDAPSSATLEVTTDRGKIEVLAGEPGRVVVEGTVTVRVGWDVPADALDIARRVAASPPVAREEGVIRLHVPTEGDARRAVIVSYRVTVPRETAIRTTSDSGETSIRGTIAAVGVRTQSAVIRLADLGGQVEVTSGSGDVEAANVAGALSVTTASSGFNGSGLGAGVRVRTQSGAVDAALTGTDDVDVKTGSSAVTLRGVRGGLKVETRSGRVTLEGLPARAWNVTTASSSITMDLEPRAGFRLDAASRSGSVVLSGASADGSVTKRAIDGLVGSGGPDVRLRSGSGAIRVTVR